MKVLSRQINSKLLCVTPTLLKSFDVGQDQVLQHFPSEILLFKERSSITIFAATNLPWAIDEALHRRFEIKIYIPLPNDEARYNLLKKCFDTISTSKKVNFLQLANDLDGCSTHDVILFCRFLTRRAIVKQSQLSEDFQATCLYIELEDIQEILKTFKLSIVSETIAKYSEWNSKFKFKMY